jgi:hypothetical protein
MRSILISAVALVLFGANAQAQPGGGGEVRPSAAAVFTDRTPKALADAIRSACRDHGFDTEIRNALSLTCVTTGLAFPKDGRLIAHHSGEHSDLDTFTFALEPSGDRVVVFEKTRHAVEMPVSSMGGKQSDAARAREQARAADIQTRLERFLTELGGVLQAIDN